jgi:hypothetical protein
MQKAIKVLMVSMGIYSSMGLVSKVGAADIENLSTLESQSEALENQLDAKLARIDSLAQTCKSAKIQKWVAGTTSAVALVGTATVAGGFAGMMGGSLFTVSEGSVVGGVLEGFVNLGIGAAVGAAAGGGVSSLSLYTYAKKSSESFIEITKNGLSESPKNFKKQLRVEAESNAQPALAFAESLRTLRVEKALMKKIARETLDQIESESNLITASWKESEYCEVSISAQMLELNYLAKEKIVIDLMIEGLN